MHFRLITSIFVQFHEAAPVESSGQEVWLTRTSGQIHIKQYTTS